MIRKWHNFATIASASLFVVLLGIWRVSSVGYFSQRWIVTANDFYVLQLHYGIIELNHTTCSSGNLPPDMQHQYSVWAMPHGFDVEWNETCKSVLGLGIRNQPLVFPMGNALIVATTHGQSVPLWLLTAIFAVLPLRTALRWRWLHKIGPNGCRTCGYNLSGNASRVCPECGTPV